MVVVSGDETVVVTATLVEVVAAAGAVVDVASVEAGVQAVASRATLTQTLAKVPIASMLGRGTEHYECVEVRLGQPFDVLVADRSVEAVLALFVVGEQDFLAYVAEPFQADSQ